MATKEQILLWADGVKAYRKADWRAAIETFQLVGDFSRIHFNSGMIYTQLNDHDAASICYANALDADPYLAVAFFQRAYCAFMVEDYENAESDYTNALLLLRNNDYIDYTQMGLKYRLYRSEIHFNRAMCAHSLGDGPACTQDVMFAQRVARTVEQRAIVDRAARAGVDTITLFTVPVDAVFEVGEAKVRNAAERSYLKDAKVVGSVGPDAVGWAGFDGAIIVDPGAAGSLPRTGTVLRRQPTLKEPMKDLTLARRETESPGPVRPVVAQDETLPLAFYGRSATLGRQGRGGPMERRRRSPSRAAEFDKGNARGLARSATTAPGSKMQSSFRAGSPSSPSPQVLYTRSRTPSSTGPYEQEESRLPIASSRTHSPIQVSQQPSAGALQVPFTRSRTPSDTGNSPRLARSATAVEARDPASFTSQKKPLRAYTVTDFELRQSPDSDQYPSPAPSQATSPSARRTGTVAGKTKVKIHAAASTHTTPRTILLLLPDDDATRSVIVSRCKDKLGLRDPVLEFRDPSDPRGELISVEDDDDLATAVEVMEGRWEFLVRDAVDL
ncbi:hypothetical protein HKX48_000180 [Thoreauomyces humboldtii]|nr:hypothetical protein HKX48_000180 [Thoreauomyces humboldtii]